MKEYNWKQCCKNEMKRLWENAGGPMEIIHLTTECPDCGHFIGLTQTSEDDAKKFLEDK